MSSPVNAPCPCGSGKKLKKCCGPLHSGVPAPTAEALMRARYAAYALGDVRFLVATTDPAGPVWRDDPAWREEIRRFCRDVRFEGLTVLAHEPGEHQSFVTFRARLSSGGRDVSFGERSRFTRPGGRWLYHGGERLA
ncbi:MAG: YchJ family protein [Myxococcota bacterium]